MTTHSSAAALPLALAAGTMVLAVAACGGAPTTTPSPSAAEPTATVMATTTATASTGPATSSTPTAATTPSATASGGAARCEATNLHITYADDKGGAGAGSVAGTFTILNRGSAACTLRGFPGVAYVGGDNGVQVGEPATRTGDAPTTRTLAVGKTAKVALRRTQPGNYGDECRQTAVTGFRVYLPDSTRAAFVPFRTTGCKSTSAPLLQVGPVR